MMTKIKTLLRDKREIVRFLKFAFVGTVGAVVDFTVYNLLTSIVKLPNPWGKWVPEIAVFFSLSTAIVSNFIWNRYWTYPDSRSKPIGRQFAQFYLINILAWLIRAPIIWITEGPFTSLAGRLLPVDTEMAVKVGENLAWALGVGIAMFWNFFINRIWTYSDVDGASEEGDVDEGDADLA